MISDKKTKKNTEGEERGRRVEKLWLWVVLFSRDKGKAHS
jgi:hypothetical protein